MNSSTRASSAPWASPDLKKQLYWVLIVAAGLFVVVRAGSLVTSRSGAPAEVATPASATPPDDVAAIAAPVDDDALSASDQDFATNSTSDAAAPQHRFSQPAVDNDREIPRGAPAAQPTPNENPTERSIVGTDRPTSPEPQEPAAQVETAPTTTAEVPPADVIAPVAETTAAMRNADQVHPLSDILPPQDDPRDASTPSDRELADVPQDSNTDVRHAAESTPRRDSGEPNHDAAAQPQSPPTLGTLLGAVASMARDSFGQATDASDANDSAPQPSRHASGADSSPSGEPPQDAEPGDVPHQTDADRPPMTTSEAFSRLFHGNVEGAVEGDVHEDATAQSESPSTFPVPFAALPLTNRTTAPSSEPEVQADDAHRPKDAITEDSQQPASPAGDRDNTPASLTTDATQEAAGRRDADQPQTDKAPGDEQQLGEEATATRATGQNDGSVVPEQELPSGDARPAEQFSGVLLVNPAANELTVRYLINGHAFELAPGQSHPLPAGRTWRLRFHRGGELGEVSESLRPGTFEFRASEAGWALSPRRAEESRDADTSR